MLCRRKLLLGESAAAGPSAAPSNLTQPQGLHRRRHSLLGVRFWASQRLLENALRRAAAPLQGTWLMCMYLRALGAKIGAWATLRMTNPALAPDMLVVGAGVHVGDAANLVAAHALDAETILVGRIELGSQARHLQPSPALP